jgi:hypothetical protein
VGPLLPTAAQVFEVIESVEGAGLMLLCCVWCAPAVLCGTKDDAEACMVGAGRIGNVPGEAAGAVNVLCGRFVSRNMFGNLVRLNPRSTKPGSDCLVSTSVIRGAMELSRLNGSRKGR